jgi:hypothetical protein
MTIRLASLALSTALLFASGCSLFNSSPKADDAQRVVEEKALVDAQTAPEAPKQGIEVTWEMPSEPVDGFIIRYGSSPGALSKEVTIVFLNLFSRFCRIFIDILFNNICLSTILNLIDFSVCSLPYNLSWLIESSMYICRVERKPRVCSNICM